MQGLKDLKDKIQTLETERARLINEVESLRKAAETRAAALESDVNQMRQEARGLRELLGSEEKMAVKIPLHKSVAAAHVTPVVQTEPEPEPDIESSPEELIPENANLENDATNHDAVLKTLNIEERKVIEVLAAHGGRYTQKNIRTEADLSWLQTNRVISRLVDRGVVTLVKNGVLTDVLLTENLK